MVLQVRCDQTFPYCAQCVKASLNCVYNHLQAREPSVEPSAIRQSATTTSQLDQSKPQEWALQAPMVEEDLFDFGAAFDDCAMSNTQQPDFSLNAIDFIPTPRDTASVSLSSAESTDPPTSNGSSIFKQQFSGISPPAPASRQTFRNEFERLSFLQAGENDMDSIVDHALQGKLRRYRHLEEDLRSAAAKIESLDSCLLPPSVEPRGLLPPRSDCETLVHLYLDSCESVTRILYVPTFLSCFNSIWDHPEVSDEYFLHQLLLVMAIGASFCDESSPPLSRPDHQNFNTDLLRNGWHSRTLSWINAAQNWLSQRISADPQTDLNTLQICCLLLVARKSNHAPGSDPFWLTDDVLVRKAMSLGLHREPTDSCPSVTPCEAKMRRRLWCTILEISIQGSLTSGLPPVMGRESYDCRPPSNLDDSVIGSETKVNVNRSGIFTRSTISCLLAKSHGLRLQILNIFNSPSGGPPYQKALELATELTVICDANLRALKSFQAAAATTPGALQPTNLQIKILDLCTRRFIVLLHSPLAGCARLTPSYYYSRKMRMETCAHILQYPLAEMSDLARPSEAADATTSDNTNIFNIWFLGCLMRHSSLPICHDLIDEIAENTFPITNRDYHAHLLGLVRQSVGAFQGRIAAASSRQPASASQSGYNTWHVSSTLTSCHEFLVLHCAVAQIDAMRQLGHAPGISEEAIDREIFHAAKKGLDICCEVLDSALRDIRMTQAQDWLLGSDASPSMALATLSSRLGPDDIDSWHDTLMRS